MISRMSLGPIRVLLLVSVCLFTLGPSVAFAFTNEPIGDQTGVRRYALSNGLEVVVMQTDTHTGADAASGDTQLWLAVRAGTMDERDAQRGAAGVLERMLHLGLDGYDEETIKAILKNEGGPKRDTDASGTMVMLDQTLLMGQAPGDDPSQIESLLGFYRQVLRPESWSFEDDRVERAKSDLIEWVEGMLSPEMRARQGWLPELLGGGRLGTRVGLPDPDAIARLDSDTVEDFAKAYLRPNRATLIVIGGRETVQIDAMISRMLGDLESGVRTDTVDLRIGLDTKQSQTRSVMGLDPELEGHLAALVWVQGKEDACLSSWSVCAAGYGKDQMRSMVIDRVAGELIRHRLDRLGIASLGRDTEISVDQVGLAGQIDLLQCVVQRKDSDDWASTLRLLIGECDRLVRDGAGSEEIVRARGSLLARWHRAADDWRTQSNADRVWLVHWLVTSGRAVVNMVNWDEQATRMMSTISEQEINIALKRMLEPSRVRVLAVARGEPADSESMRVQIESLTDEMRRAPLTSIDPDWMRTLGGTLLDETTFDGEITRVTQHGASGAWGAQLGNGVDVWARATPSDEQPRVEYCATLSGLIFRDGSMCEDEIDAAMQAWLTPSSESRSARWLAVYMQEHGLELTARRVVGGVQLHVRAKPESSRSALQLMYLLLDRPMIDAQSFEAWDAQRTGDNLLSKDPLERALITLYQPVLTAHARCEIALDDAQRTLTRIVRNADMGVGIAGSIDPSTEIEQAGALLGKLVHRETSPAQQAEKQQSVLIDREKSILLQQAGQDSDELTLGMLGSTMDDLQQLRATILAAMVLSDRARAVAEAQGLENTRVDAQVIRSDAIGDQWALVMRASGSELSEAESVLAEALATIVSEGISDEELAAVKAELDRSIERYFDRAGYWSRRLSQMGLHGRDVQDLWSIREGYAQIDATQASGAIRDAVNGQDRFRVLIEGQQSR